VLAALVANGGNVKRTSRDTGVSPAAIRSWRGKQEQGHGVAVALIEDASAQFVVDATRVRNKALVQMERLIDEGKVNAATLNTIFGTLTDKIHLVQGLPTNRTEHTGSTLPDAEQLKALMQPFVANAIVMAEQRHSDIIEAEVVREISQ